MGRPKAIFLSRWPAFELCKLLAFYGLGFRGCVSTLAAGFLQHIVSQGQVTRLNLLHLVFRSGSLQLNEMLGNLFDNYPWEEGVI